MRPCPARRRPDRPERVALLFQLLEQRMEDLTLACLGGHEVPEVAHLGLSDTVNTSEALLKCGWGSRADRS